MPPTIRTRRWCDPAAVDDGRRILVCRYRPRGVRAEDETWDEWWKELGPSVALHADYYGKGGRPPIEWSEYRRRYLDEMQAQTYRIAALRESARAGEALTLLCSSQCIDPERCHATLLRGLVLSDGGSGRRGPSGSVGR